MYCEHFRLHTRPFRRDIARDEVFFSRSHEECLTRLLYTVNEGKGAVLLTGMHGTGKSLLLDIMVDELIENGYQVARIPNADLPPDQFLEEVLYQLGLASSGLNRAEMLRALHEHLTRAVSEDREVVVVCDEVQFVSDPATFTEMHQLMNIAIQGRHPVTLVLAGEPDAIHRLEEFGSLAERLVMRARLEVLNREDVAHYLNHRLEQAGAAGPMFTSGALEILHRATHGVPRRLDHLADTCLLIAAGEGLPQVDERLARLVVTEWQGRG